MQISDDKILPGEIQCPDCGADLNLSLRERTERKFTCPECKETFVIKDNNMLCPVCKSEFVPGTTECPECKVPLVESLAEEDMKQDGDLAKNAKLVTVYTPENEADHLTMTSLLQSAGIVYHSKNAGVQNLIGIGETGAGFNVATGPIQIQVFEDDFEKAKEVIHSNLKVDELDIPEICPACNASTQKLPQCPDCGLIFVVDAEIEQDEVDGSDSPKDKKRAHGSGVNVISGFMMGLFSYLAISNPSVFVPYKRFLYEQHQFVPTIEPTGDKNGDGISDYWVEYRSGKIFQEIFDLNFDGTPDAWCYYDDGSITRYESDNNFDGRLDQWAYYKNGLMSESVHDRNNDGKPDTWEYYNPLGEISEINYDLNFDDHPDHWETYEKGAPIKYVADNDYDDIVDEWALLEHWNVKERKWSFRNDKIADKKAVYENGRKVSEAYDRNRDGEFEEVILLDEFERVRKVENKNAKNQD